MFDGGVRVLLSLFACAVKTALSKICGGELSDPVRSNPLGVIFPTSYCTTPPKVWFGWLTTTSSSRMSPSGLGTPPPTISPNRIPLNVALICVAMVAAGLLPIRPAGRDTITTLCPATEPKEYRFLSSSSSRSRFSCFSSNISRAAASSTGSAYQSDGVILASQSTRHSESLRGAQEGEGLS